jgi:hypothetical protein
VFFFFCLKTKAEKQKTESDKKMSEAKDPAIKLFGKTIPVPEIPATGLADSTGASAASSGPVVDDSTDQDHDCSTNSSPEANTDRDAEEREAEKVWDSVDYLDSGSDPLF